MFENLKAKANKIMDELEKQVEPVVEATPVVEPTVEAPVEPTSGTMSKCSCGKFYVKVPNIMATCECGAMHA